MRTNHKKNCIAFIIALQVIGLWLSGATHKDSDMMVSRTVEIFLGFLETGCKDDLRQHSAGGFLIALDSVEIDKHPDVRILKATYTKTSAKQIQRVVLDVIFETPNSAGQWNLKEQRYDLSMVEKDGIMLIVYMKLDQKAR